MFDLLCYKPLNQFGTSLVIIFVPSIARKCRRRKPRKSACHIPRRATNRCSEWGGLGHDGERGRLRVASAIRESVELPIFGNISTKFRSFSAVSAPIFASKYAFYSIFQNLPDYLAEIFEIWHHFVNFATFAKILLKFHRNC